MAEENGNVVDLSALGSFNFTPDWAKKDERISVGNVRPERERDASGGDRGRNSADGRKPFSPKGPRDRKPSGDRDRKPRFEDRPRPLDCDVKILPEPKALGTIFRKLRSDAHAFKLKDLAYFLLDNPESILLKIVPKSEQTFFQCKACGFASTRREDVESHILSVHIGDYYESREVECEPPKGNFSCVARCGLSGVLLGPPNIHEFNSVVKEMVRTRYPDMTEEQYRSHIEMVHDKDVIEEWRSGATKKTVYLAKGVEGASPLARDQAEGEFRRTIMPSVLDEPKNLVITADAAMKSPCKPLVWAAKDAVEAERRAPYGMCFALRGAFHHRKLKFFRANDSRGPEFVTNVEYRKFDAAHAIPELAFAAKFIADNPCCDKTEFPKDVPDFEKHVAWLVETGHVVAFTNGVYSEVDKFPKYGPQWKKRRNVAETKAAAPETAKAETPETPDNPETPETPENPEKPENPEIPETPENPETPVAQEATEVPETAKEEIKDETAAELAE